MPFVPYASLGQSPAWQPLASAASSSRRIQAWMSRVLRGSGAVYLSFMPPLRALRVSAGWYQFVYLFASLWRWPRETQTPGVPVAGLVADSAC